MRRSSMPSARAGGALLALLALLAPLTLAGCATTAPPRVITLRPELPALPGSLAVRCADPGVRAGQPFAVELARSRQALAACTRKQADGVAFYEDLRKRLGR